MNNTQTQTQAEVTRLRSLRAKETQQHEQEQSKNIITKTEIQILGLCDKMSFINRNTESKWSKLKTHVLYVLTMMLGVKNKSDKIQ